MKRFIKAALMVLMILGVTVSAGAVCVAKDARCVPVPIDSFTSSTIEVCHDNSTRMLEIHVTFKDKKMRDREQLIIVRSVYENRDIYGFNNYHAEGARGSHAAGGVFQTPEGSTGCYHVIALRKTRMHRDTPWEPSMLALSSDRTSAHVETKYRDVDHLHHDDALIRVYRWPR